MSDRDQELVETLRRLYDAFNAGDFDAAVAAVRPDFELAPPGGQTPHKGRDAVRAWMEPDAFEEQTIEPIEFTVNGDKVHVRQRLWARGAGSGIEMDVVAWGVWTFDDEGVPFRVEGFLPGHEAESLEAAGLTAGERGSG